jgi:hypothetical protein
MSLSKNLLAGILAASLAIGATGPSLAATKLTNYSSAKALTLKLASNKSLKCSKPVIQKNQFTQNQIRFSCEDDTSGYWFATAAKMKPFLDDRKSKLFAGEGVIYGDNWYVETWGGGASNAHNVQVAKTLKGVSFYK